MKPFLFLGLAMSAPLIAADASKVLLSGTAVSAEEATASGAAKAIVGDMTIGADAIKFDKDRGILICDGAVTIRIAGNVVTARDCTIQLSPGEKKLFFLSRGEIHTSSPSAFPLVSPDLVGRASEREELILEFRSRLHFEQKPNKAPEPTPGSATPRANEGKSR